MVEMDNMKFLVTGANGPLGARVAAHLAGQGRTVIGLSRKSSPANFFGEWRTSNLLDADAVRTCFADVQVVVHCASNVQNPEEDVQALKNLMAASQETGFHLVYVSICGIEQAAAVLEYYAMKIRNEEALRASGVPHTIVCISQFHPFLSMLLSYQVEGHRLELPRLTLQPIDTDFAAQQLASYALLRPEGKSYNVHGPEALHAEQLGRAWCKARIPLTVAVTDQGTGLLQAFASLTPVQGQTGGMTWAEWLLHNPPENNPFGEKQI
jgi:uncharacterized protein YbjT (DUF2867 family)